MKVEQDIAQSSTRYPSLKVWLVSKLEKPIPPRHLVLHLDLDEVQTILVSLKQKQEDLMSL